MGNAAHGGWEAARSEAFLENVGTFFDQGVDLAALRG